MARTHQTLFAIRFAAVWTTFAAFAGAAVVDWSATSNRPSIRAASIDGITVNPLVRLAGDNSVWLASNDYLPEYGDNKMRIDTYVSRIAPDGRTLFTAVLQGSYPTGLVLDRQGNAVIAGPISSASAFPTTAGALRTQNPAGYVAKISPAGAILFAAQLAAKPSAVAVDTDGAAYVTGIADANFRSTPGALKPEIGPKDCWPRHSAEPIACSDAFVAKLRPDGSALVFATFLGGRSEENGADIAVDSSGNAYVTGETRSDDFPTTSTAFQRAYGGTVTLGPLTFGDVFVSKLDPAGRTLIYSTYLGGRGVEQPGGISVDAQGRMVITGSTQSVDFPVSPGAPQQQYGGGSEMPGATSDAFIVRLNERGERMWATYFGRDEREYAGAVAIGPAGSIYANVVGPVRAVIQNRRSGTCEPASGVIVLDPATGRLIAHFAQWPMRGPLGLDVDTTGRAYLAGEFPGGRFQPLPGFAYVWILRVDFDREPDVLPECVVNAASLLSRRWAGGGPEALSRGEVISIMGEKLGPPEPLVGVADSMGRLPTSLGGTRVFVSGRPATLLYVNERQINAVVPFELPNRPAVVSVERNQAQSDSSQIGLARALPGLFTIAGEGGAAALNQDGTINSASNPAPRGSVISLFGTGFGAMSPQPDSLILTPHTPPWAAVTERMEAFIGAPVESGAAGMAILYAGAAPGLAPGVVQVNVRIPANAGRGRVPIKVVLYTEPLIFETTQNGVFVHVD
jgi:uncharacterized protein (TIGR03437 family)